MIPTTVRVVVIALCVAVGAWFVATGEPNGLLLLIAAALFARGQFRYGPVWLALHAVRKGRADDASRLLAQVREPRALTPQFQAYYEMASGLVAAERGQSARAEAHLRAALDLPLRTGKDRALVETALAEVLVARGAHTEAGTLLSAATARSPGPAVVREIEDASS